MGKYYCDYCDVFLTHDSAAVRKQHNDGNRHKQNVCSYYLQLITSRTQSKVDQVIEEFEVKIATGELRPTYGLPGVEGAIAIPPHIYRGLMPAPAPTPVPDLTSPPVLVPGSIPPSVLSPVVGPVPHAQAVPSPVLHGNGNPQLTGNALDTASGVDTQQQFHARQPPPKTAGVS